MIPSTMKSPRDSRDGVWPMGAVPNARFGGVMQIHITRMCDMACTHCTQGSQLAGPVTTMTTEQFEESMRSLVGYRGVIGIFGGNPTLAKNFEEICWILKKFVPFDRRGLWSNNLMGKGEICRKTFNPDVSNLNVHQSQEAWDEISRDWPLAMPKGLDSDSRHSPPFVAMQDMEDMTDEERWRLIGDCDVNQRWSALIGVFRGELRGYFCELAGAQAMLHQGEADYPDTGHRIVPGWWNKGMEAFEAQVRYHCFACGHPLRGYGDLAGSGTIEQVSATHAAIYKLKRLGSRTIQNITRKEQLGPSVTAATQYLPGEKA